jgi:hypothetical protein
MKHCFVGLKHFLIKGTVLYIDYSNIANTDYLNIDNANIDISIGTLPHPHSPTCKFT